MLDSKPPNFSIGCSDLQMARLTDDEINQGKKNYLKVENGQLVLYLAENFGIIYKNTNTEEGTNPVIGQQETINNTNTTYYPFPGTENHVNITPRVYMRYSPYKPRVSLGENHATRYEYATRPPYRSNTKLRSFDRYSNRKLYKSNPKRLVRRNIRT